MRHEWAGRWSSPKSDVREIFSFHIIFGSTVVEGDSDGC